MLKRLEASRSADSASRRSDRPRSSGVVDLERALEGLFRLGANRRFNQQQAMTVGAVVTRAGYAMLRSLHDQGPLSVRRLADACAMDAATASRQLLPLVEDGLVERRGVEGDARQVELVLTDQGREVYERIVEYRLDQLTSVLEGWPDDERDMLSRLVLRLVGDLARLPRATRWTRTRRRAGAPRRSLGLDAPREVVDDGLVP